jgi:TonB family protein
MLWLSLLIAASVSAPGLAQDGPAAPGEAGEAAGPRLPVLLFAAPAAYPPEALAEGLEASVLLELVVSSTGEVVEARVVESAGEAFDRSALLAARAFRFSPGLDEAGQPAPAVIGYRVVFKAEAAPALSVEGRVLEAGVRAPLEGVELVAEGPLGSRSLAVTDGEGRFRFVGLATGTWVVTASGPALGERREVVEVREGTVVGLELFLVRDALEDALAGEEILVRDARVTSEITERRLAAEEIQYLPGTNGDVVKVVQNLPGVARPPLGIGQLIIRGTAPEDSRYFIDGTPIPLVFHFSGLTSILPGEAIQEVAYLPGNYSVRYGRILGGLVDLRTDAELPERSGGHVSVDIYQAAAFFEQRIGDKTAVTASGRRSYVDAVLNPILSNSGGGLTVQAPRYYDGQLRLLHETESGATWDALAFASDDRFRFLGGEADEDGEQETFASLVDRFQRLRVRRTGDMAGGWTQETSLSLGPEKRFFEFSTESEALEERLTVAVREEVSRPIAPDRPLGLRFGVDVQGGSDRFLFYQEGFGPREEGQSNFIAPATYAEASILAGRLTLIPGLRGDLLTYDNGYSAAAVDPRLSLRYLLLDYTTLKGSFGQFSAFPTLRQVDPGGDGNPDLIAARSLQASLGVEQQLGGRVSAELNGFYNTLDNLVVGREDRLRFFTGPPPVGPFDTDPYANDGVGRIYGLETMVRYDGPSAVGLLTVTLSRSERQDRPDEPVELFAYDQPVVLNALWSQQLKKNRRVGARLRYGSGNPYTPVVNRVYDLDSRSFIPVYGDRSSARLSPFYSVDLRYDKTWTFDRWSLMAYLDLQNATFAQNVEVITWSYDYSEEETILSNPPLPVFGFKGEW